MHAEPTLAPVQIGGGTSVPSVAPRTVTYPLCRRCSARRTCDQLDAARHTGKLFFSMTDYSMHHPLLRLVPAALAVAATLLSPTERACAQAPRSLAPRGGDRRARVPVVGCRRCRGRRRRRAPWLGGHTGDRYQPARFWERPAPRARAPSLSPSCTGSSDGVLGAVGLAGNAIGLSLSVTLQAVPEEGLDPSNINWGIDRDAIGNPSTSADKASNVAVFATLAGPPLLALLTQPGVHGFGNVIRRPFVLYGESVLLAQAFTQVLKPAIDRPRPFTYLPASERPTESGYDVTAEDAFLSMPSGHAATTFAAASYAATDNLLSHPDAGTKEHVAVAAIGGLLAGFTSTCASRPTSIFPRTCWWAASSARPAA